MMENVKDAIIPIFKPHMTEKNWSKIGVFAGFYGSPEFAGFFLNDEEVAEERASFLEGLTALLPEQARRPVCVVHGCLLPRCTIPGSGHCLPHHALKFSAPPTVDDFLRNSHYCNIFRDWTLAASPDAACLLDFSFKAADYRTVSSRATLRQRGPALFRKFLAPAARHRIPLEGFVEEEVVSEAISLVEAVIMSDAPRANAFLPIATLVSQALSDVFRGPFSESGAFGEWAEMNMGLPMPSVPTARAALLEQLGLNATDVFSGGAGAGVGAGAGAAGVGAGAAGSGAGGESGVSLSAAFLEAVGGMSVTPGGEVGDEAGAAGAAAGAGEKK
jgi:hypothetical protein